MANKAKTTEDLRQTLFDAIDGVEKGTMEIKKANAIAGIADRIIKTADLELKYANTLDKLDKSDQGITPGPLLLAGGKQSRE